MTKLKPFTDAQIEAEVRKSLTKSLGHVPSPAELQKGIRDFKIADLKTRKAIEGKLRERNK